MDGLVSLGMNVAKRRGMACAHVAVAGKLADPMHLMSCDDSEFRWGKQAGEPAAA